MNIGIIGVNDKPISRTATGGTEVFTALLANALKRRGNTVYLFASGDSHVPGVRLIPTTSHSYLTIKKKLGLKSISALDRERCLAALNARTLFLAKAHERTVDIFHDNTANYITGAVTNCFAKPVVSTLHLPPMGINHYLQLPAAITRPTAHYVAISRYQQKFAPDAATMIYNGIALSDYPFVEKVNQAHMVWIGRVDPNTPKGLPEAMRTATAVQRPLHYACFIEDQEYFQKVVQPLQNSYIRRSIHTQTPTSKAAFFGAGKLALLPIQWEEPFGLVAIESMAAGTPVVGFAHGAFPEIIVDGVTGFLVNPTPRDKRGSWIVKKTGLAGLREAVERIYHLSPQRYLVMRQACRARVEKNFSIDVTAANYERLYRRLCKR